MEILPYHHDGVVRMVFANEQVTNATEDSTLDIDSSIEILSNVTQAKSKQNNLISFEFNDELFYFK